MARSHTGAWMHGSKHEGGVGGTCGFMYLIVFWRATGLCWAGGLGGGGQPLHRSGHRGGAGVGERGGAKGGGRFLGACAALRHHGVCARASADRLHVQPLPDREAQRRLSPTTDAGAGVPRGQGVPESYVLSG